MLCHVAVCYMMISWYSILCCVDIVYVMCMCMCILCMYVYTMCVYIHMYVYIYIYIYYVYIYIYICTDTYVIIRSVGLAQSGTSQGAPDPTPKVDQRLLDLRVRWSTIMLSYDIYVMCFRSGGGGATCGPHHHLACYPALPMSAGKVIPNSVLTKTTIKTKFRKFGVRNKPTTNSYGGGF